MNYPDGTTIRRADLVWWNEWTCTGYIQSIAETPEEYEAFGLDRPHVFIGPKHPFDSSETLGVAYGEQHLAVEGIEPLSVGARENLSLAVEKAGIAGETFHASPDIADGKKRGWIFEISEGDELVRMIRIPDEDGR